MVARATGYTVRQVINILNRGGVGYADEQGDLFPEPKAASAAPLCIAKLPQAHNPFGLPGQAPIADPAKSL